jgi:chromosome segregation ATPase
MKETMVACEDAKAEALSAKDQQIAALVANHEEAIASVEAAKAKALSAKDEELALYTQAHQLSNEEHAAVLAEKDREASVVLFQLKESEEAVSELENRIRKLTREKKFLKDELDEVF